MVDDETSSFANPPAAAVGVSPPPALTWAAANAYRKRGAIHSQLLAPEHTPPALEDATDSVEKSVSDNVVDFGVQSAPRGYFACTYCHKPGHGESHCYRKHGFPEHWGQASPRGPDASSWVPSPAVPSFGTVLPQVRSTNNIARGGFGRGRWNNDRGGPGLLPRQGPYSQRQGYGYGRGNFSGPRDERLVSELKFDKSEETLARKCMQFQAPYELACYSRADGRGVYFDDRSLRLFKRLITEDIGADLNEGFDTFIEKEDLGSKGFGDLLTSIRNKNIPLQYMHFVTYRNNLNKILATAYIRHEPWEMGVHKRKGVVYLDVHNLPERPQSDRQRRMSYWGYCFETLATEDANRSDGEAIHDVDANVEFCSVLKSKLGAHQILMGAEMDCCDSTDDGRRFYVELKTSRKLEYHTEERFEREKLLKYWIQSFLAGVPYIVIGFRDDAGRLVRTERLKTTEITQRVKMKGYWQGGVCLAFADEVLSWLYETVQENKDYILRFAPPFTRLELLQAQSCPVEITEHVQLL